jgi:hypothetical protein
VIDVDAVAASFKPRRSSGRAYTGADADDANVDDDGDIDGFDLKATNQVHVSTDNKGGG